MGASWFQRFWFAEVPLTRLAAFRILILALAMMDLIAYSDRVFMHANAVSAGGDVPWTPIYLFEVLGVQPIGIETAQTVFIVAMVESSFRNLHTS